jgi:hypothetical protein
MGYQSQQDLERAAATRAEDMQRKEYERQYFFELGKSKDPSDVSRAAVGTAAYSPTIARAFEAKAAILATDETMRTADNKILLANIEKARTPREVERVMKWFGDLHRPEAQDAFLGYEAQSAAKDEAYRKETALLATRASTPSRRTEGQAMFDAFAAWKNGLPYSESDLLRFRQTYAGKDMDKDYTAAQKEAQAEYDRRNKLVLMKGGPDAIISKADQDVAIEWSTLSPEERIARRAQWLSNAMMRNQSTRPSIFGSSESGGGEVNSVGLRFAPVQAGINARIQTYLDSTGRGR